MLVYLIFTTLILILWPSDAFAWGPGTHLEIATSLLKDVTKFSPIVIPLLKTFKNEFIYGMVSADILMGKKLAGYHNHSHNWKVAWSILEKCKTDRERASAYGYLTHLATDIVAHNYYIPYMIIKSHSAKMVNHTYWELRFDMHVKEPTWESVKKIANGDFDTFDQLLESTLVRPMFSFKTNKRVFNSILLVQQIKKLRQGVKIHSSFSQWPLTATEIKHYRYLALKLAKDFLRDLDKAECQKGEPAGIERIKYANRMRKSIKRFKKRDLFSEKDLEKFIERIKIELKKTIFEPDAHLPDSFEAL